jgi:AcrR family transcriptional regulator
MTSPINSSATADKIVLSAAQLFARQGYHGTSTREIARLAGVSENTLFRHFDHKEDLFWSALLSHTKNLRIRRDLQEGIAKCEPPEIVFPKLLEFLTETVRYRPEFLRLIAVAFLELHWKAEAFSQEHLAPIIVSISHYLETNIRSGKLRDLDPSIVTAAVVTTVLMHQSISKLVNGNLSASGESRDAGRVYAKFWLDLLTPRASEITLLH